MPGGVGVARQIVRGLERRGLSTQQARERIYLIDSKGLILKDRKGLEPYKLELAQEPARVAGWKLQGSIPSLLETVREAKVTVLLGLSGQRGAFGEDVVKAVAANTPYPVVFALSNPTANSEAVPADIYRWTDGKAMVATGSPFEDVEWNGTPHPVGQGNNAFIFPGLGLGVLLTRAKRVTDGMLTAASLALADYTDGARLAQGALYPRMDRIRAASRQVAMAVIRQAQKDGVATRELPADLEALLEAEMWRPEFLPLRRAPALDDAPRGTHREGGARRSRGDLHLPAVPRHRLVHDESPSPRLPAGRNFELAPTERLEEHRQQLRRNGLALVGHRQLHLLHRAPHPHAHRRPLPRVPQRVGQQVGEHLPHARSVPPPLAPRVSLQSDFLARVCHRELVDDLVAQEHQVVRLALQGKASAQPPAREVEQVGHHPPHRVRARPDAGGRAHHALPARAAPGAAACAPSE